MVNENNQWQQHAGNWQQREQWQALGQDSWQQQGQRDWHNQQASQQAPSASQYQWYRPDGSLDISDDERTWAILAHISALVATVVSAGWLSFVGPLVIWALQKNRSPYVRIAAAQSFNFNLGLWLMNVIGWIMVFTILLLPVGLILMLISFVLLLWHHIRASIAAARRQPYRYPFQLPILH